MEMFINAVKEMEPAKALSAGGMLVMMISLILFLGFLRYLLNAAGFCKMFGKAGIAGWKAFIPFYNDYTKYRMVWDGKMFFAFLAASLANTLMVNMDSPVAHLANIALSLITIFMLVKLSLKLAKAFGKGPGMALLMLIAPFIAAPVLGFGKAQYIGEVTTLQE